MRARIRRFNPLPSCEGRQVHRSSRRWSRLLQSTSLLRGKTDFRKRKVVLVLLQSTSLLRGKTTTPFINFSVSVCFNPLPSCEGRQLYRLTFLPSKVLQSTSLLRGKTCLPFSFLMRFLRFNPLPSCEGRLQVFSHSVFSEGASIHFPLAREDSVDAPI